MCDPAVGVCVYGISLQVFGEVGGQLRAGGLWHRDDVLDARRVVDLTANALGHDGDSLPFSGSVDGCGCSCRTTAEYHNIVATLHSLVCCAAVGAEMILQFVEQCAELTATHMQQLTVDIHCGHRLDVELVDFLLRKCPVDHLVRDIRIEQCHDVESLYHVGTVGTRQRHVGCQSDVALQRRDALAQTVVRQIAPLSISVEQCQQQRGELMSVGDAPERDARFLAVAKNVEAKRLAAAVFYSDM